MAVTVTQSDINTAGHYKVLRFKYTRDGGAEMSTAHVVKEPVVYGVLTKTDGTQVDTRNETPSGLTFTLGAEQVSITIADALLPVSDSVYMDLYIGPVINA